MPKLAPSIVSIALAEVGEREKPMNSNCGPTVNEYKAACVGMNPRIGWPWCAAFVCWVVRMAMDGRYTFNRPTTAGAWDLINWSLAQDNSTQTKRNPGSDIQAGDILVYTFSHCGFAVSAPKRGSVGTVEGNTDVAGSREGGGVYQRSRSTKLVKARIRFTV